jgi:signal recognition particle receptor subunit beta
MREMVVFNYSGKEVSAKIVYYGPGLSGKTTNLEHIYGKVPERQRGKMVSMKTKTDRTLFFDFLPLSAGEINGFRTRFLLYTVPGQVYYNATRKLVLKGTDGVVFVADSDPELREANKESFANLEKNLAEYGMNTDSIPLVLQYNKRDVPNAMSIEALNADLNRGNWPIVEAVAMNGDGVFETFKAITRLVFQKMNERFDRKAAKAEVSGPHAAAASATGDIELSPEALGAATSRGEGAVPSGAGEATGGGDVIHLDSMDRILGDRAPQPTALWSQPTAHAAAEPRVTERAAPAAVATAARPQAPAPAAPAASAEQEPWVVHQVRIPLTVPKVQAGRIRLVLDIDLATLPGDRSE